MAKIVNSWNEWDPLKRVIVERPEGTNITVLEPAWWYDLPEGGYPLGSFGPFPQEMVEKANEQMDNFVQVMENGGERSIIASLFSASSAVKGKSETTITK